MSNAAILDCHRESPLEIEQLVAGEVWSSIGGLYRLLVQAIVPGHEATYGFLWLKSVLGADSIIAANAPGGIWRGSAPAGTATPYVIIGMQSGLDVLTLNAVRIMTQPLYQVRAIGPALISTTIAAAANEIDVLLARTSGTI